MGRRLQGSAEGAIDHLLFFAPAYEAEDFASIYSALIEALPDRTEIAIVTAKDAAPIVESWACFADGKRSARLIDAGDYDITAWACDPLIGVRDGAQSVFFCSPGLARRDDEKAAALLAELPDTQILPSPLRFEGGNMLIGDDFLIVGADTMTVIGEDAESQLSAAIEELEGKPCDIIVIGSPDDAPAQRSIASQAGDEEWRQIFHYRSKEGTRQPIFHIDMYVTLAGRGDDGRYRVLVGDPAMAADILETPLHPLALADHFDAVADDLAARGFAVTRNPLPMIYMDEPDDRKRIWYYASSNNALVQRSEEAGDIVWLPAFGHDNWPELAATDARMREIWEALGFETRMIGNIQRLTENLGGLHCLTNVLRRG